MKITKKEKGCVFINHNLEYKVNNGPKMEAEIQYIFYCKDGVWTLDVIEVADLKIIEFNRKTFEEEYSIQKDMREKFKAVGIDLNKDIDEYIEKQTGIIKPVQFLKQHGIIVIDKPVKVK